MGIYVESERWRKAKIISKRKGVVGFWKDGAAAWKCPFTCPILHYLIEIEGDYITIGKRKSSFMLGKLFQRL